MHCPLSQEIPLPSICSIRKAAPHQHPIKEVEYTRREVLANLTSKGHQMHLPPRRSPTLSSLSPLLSPLYCSLRLLAILLLLSGAGTGALWIETTPLEVISRWNPRDLQCVLQKAQHSARSNLKALYQVLRYRRFSFETHYYLIEPPAALYEAILEGGQGDQTTRTEALLTLLPLNLLQSFSSGRHLLTDRLVPHQGYPLGEEWDPARFAPPQQLSLLRHINAGQARGHLEVSLCGYLIDAGAFDLLVEEGETLWQLVDWPWFEECLRQRSRDVGKVMGRLLGVLREGTNNQDNHGAGDEPWADSSASRPSGAPPNAPSDDLAFYRLLMLHSVHRHPNTLAYLERTRGSLGAVHRDMLAFFSDAPPVAQDHGRLDTFHRILTSARVPPHLRPAWVMEHVLIAGTKGSLSWEDLLPTLVRAFEESHPMQIPPYMTRKLLSGSLAPEHGAHIYRHLPDAWQRVYHTCCGSRCHFPKKHQAAAQLLLNWQRRHFYRLSQKGAGLSPPPLGGLLSGGGLAPRSSPETSVSLEQEIERATVLMDELGLLAADGTIRLVCQTKALPSIMRLMRGHILALALYDKPLPPLAPSITAILVAGDSNPAAQGLGMSALDRPGRREIETVETLLKPLDICTQASVQADQQEARQVAIQLVLQLARLFRGSRLPAILYRSGGCITC